jgi:hypothetical protein
MFFYFRERFLKENVDHFFVEVVNRNLFTAPLFGTNVAGRTMKIGRFRSEEIFSHQTSLPTVVIDPVRIEGRVQYLDVTSCSRLDFTSWNHYDFLRTKDEIET